MGLDIYAGTLTRDYSHNWKTVVQQWAEENGYSFNRITPDGEPADDGRNCPRLRFRRRWRTGGIRSWPPFLSRASPPTPPGRRIMRSPTTPTSRTGTPSALCCWWPPAIRTTSRCPPPWRRAGTLGSTPLVARLASDEERVWSLFRGTTWWLPLEAPLLFQGPLPTDDPTLIATLGGLRKELEKLNHLAWQADEDTILGWARHGGIPGRRDRGPEWTVQQGGHPGAHPV